VYFFESSDGYVFHVHSILEKPVYDGTIMEGEMYENTFMVYDILLECGKVVGNVDFLTRLKSVETVKKNAHKSQIRSN